MAYKKGVLIGTFVEKKNILSFIGNLQTSFGIQAKNVFIYNVEGNDEEYLTTFKVMNKDAYMGKIQGASVMHVKNKCIFSINALNKLIAELNDGSVPNDAYQINWDEYANKLIIVKHGVLHVLSLSKIIDKSIFFN